MAEWKRARVGDLCDIVKGETGLASSTPGPYPLVATGADRRSCDSWQFDTDAVCIPLVSSTGHGKKTLNYVHYQSGKFAIGTILAAVIPKDPSILTARFLHLYLSHFKDTVLVPLMKGAANVSLSMKEIASVQIPVPPLDEQQSLIDLIFHIEDEHRDLLAETNRQGEILKQLCQAVLQEAVEGKLTASWRKQHPVVKGDLQYDAAALLAQIKGDIERMVKEGKIRKEKFLPAIADSDKPFDLPDGWVWCRLGALSDIRGGKRVPVGHALTKTPTPYIYIRVSDMAGGTILDSDTRYLDESTYEHIKNYTISKDDLYMTIVGATIGKCGLVPDKFHNMNLTENAAKISPILVNKEYLYSTFESPFCQNQFIDKTKQVGVQKMALNRLQTTIIPLPPLAEQQAIIARVDSLMTTIDELEKQIAERKEQAQLLLQTVLREAFDES
ncbi:MAG: restriction endonuclease subunit S [Desulfuromonadaceae bacterium]|nr:restriction endonuclease subunit S [Desulfuromonadaceae bacterium]